MAIENRTYKKMQPPTDREVFENELGTYWLDNGFIVSISSGLKRTISNTTRDIALVKRITNNKKLPFLIYISDAPAPDADTREFVAKQLPDVYLAMAIVSKFGIGNIIKNVLFRFMPPSIPMKNFTNTEEAREWLKKFL